ncbi:MAG: pectate lyase [Fibromonadaceae bacterium]|jgi:PelA/Pel-15E family pectate lyase|nr:pectate lyase [Fibromonadaceae bacterium]
MNRIKLSLPMIMFIGALSLFAANASAQNYGDWGSLRSQNDNWYATNSRAVSIADEILSKQLPDGGWRKGHEVTSGEWAKSTIDNDATTSQIEFLARFIKNRSNPDSKYLNGLNKGLDLFFNGQYSNGGFPSIFGASSNAYQRHITFNDGAMIHVMYMLYDVANRSGHFSFYSDNTRINRARTAVDRGVDMILRSQITSNGVKSAWCQQHDMSTLAPVAGRAYELPSISGSESVGVVDFLKRYNNNARRADIAHAINAAVAWFGKVVIVGYRVENITTNGSADRRLVATGGRDSLWARFYEINTDRPMFVGRDGVKKYSMAEIEQERRAGYAWYGTWPRGLVRSGPVPVPNTTPSSSSGPSSSSSTTPTNIPPTASLTAPANNSTSLPGATISITANASDADGTVSRVEFFNGSTKLGEDASSPYEYNWTNPPAGTHLIRARAIDNGGAIGESSTIMVTVGAPISGASEFIENLVTFDPDNAEFYSINENFGSASKLFGDREFAVGPSVPASLQGAEWVSPSIQTRRLTFPTVIQFKMKKDGFINLLLEDRVSDNSEKKPAWITSAGFTATNSKISATGDSQDRTFTIYTKAVKQGDEVKLGSNSSDGFTSCFMYLIAFTEVNKPPTASITAPASGAVFAPGQTINIAATASGTAGNITKVEFFNGATKLGESTTAPYTYAWTDAPSGLHNITVSTTDNLGGTGASEAVTIIVGTPISAGNFINNLILFDPTNAEAWSVEENFDIGSKVFGDREFVAATIPDELLGAEWISTSMETRRLTSPATFIQFEVAKDGILNLLHEDRVAEKPTWIAEAGFVASEQKVVVTGDNSEDGRTFTVYTKSVEAGETITMGVNSSNGTTSSMMYLIAFVDPEGTTPIGKTSSLNSAHFSMQFSGKTLFVETSSPTVLDIFDLKGKKVASYNVQGSQTLHLNLQSGVYFAKARGMQSVKFVVR